ncbi:MAG: hypothetical protein ACYS9T_06275 [Planctomycetota bacterium]|jgi:hypothetical protein
MAEKGRERKKSAIIRRIFTWIGLGLLSLLLIAAIIFQAPWKVIALLLIFLLACTILPRPAREWFWLSVGVIIILVIIWVFLPEDNEGWRPYTFDEELAALQAKYAIPDSGNAAVIYNQLLQDYNSASFYPDFWESDWDLHHRLMYEPWSAKDYPQVARWLAGYESTVATLLEASKFEKCHFPINAEPFLFETSKRLSSMRCWAQLLIFAGNNDVGEGRVDRGLQKYTATLQLAKHLRQQSAMIELLVGIAIEALAARSLNRFVVLGETTEERLNVIQEAVVGIKHDWSEHLPRILEWEKLCTKNIWCMVYEMNPKGKIRLSRNPTAALRARYKKQWESQEMEDEEVRDLMMSYAHLTYWQKKLLKANTILSWFYMPSSPERVGQVVDALYDNLPALTDPEYDSQEQEKGLSATPLFSRPMVVSHLIWFGRRYPTYLIMNVPQRSYYRVRELYLRIAANRKGSLLSIGLRRYKNKHGRWPESLDEIESLAPVEAFIDPINGGAFVYTLTDDNFMLYSKGRNNIDEDGERRRGADDWLIWPRESDLRKKGKVNTE